MDSRSCPWGMHFLCFWWWANEMIYMYRYWLFGICHDIWSVSWLDQLQPASHLGNQVPLLVVSTLMLDRRLGIKPTFTSLLVLIMSCILLYFAVCQAEGCRTDMVMIFIPFFCNEENFGKFKCKETEMCLYRPVSKIACFWKYSLSRLSICFTLLSWAHTIFLGFFCCF